MAEAKSVPMLTKEEIKLQYPLHLSVWSNDFDGLKATLDSNSFQVIMIL